MTGLGLRRRLMVVVATTVLFSGLAGCRISSGPEPLVWTSRQIAFVVDRKRGALRMLSVRAGLATLATVPLEAVERTPAMLLDEARALLWVRCDDTLLRFELPTLQRTGRWILPEAAREARITASGSGAITLHAGGNAFVLGERVVARVVVPAMVPAS